MALLGQKTRVSFGHESVTYGAEVNAVNWLGLQATFDPSDSIDWLEQYNAGTSTNNIELYQAGKLNRGGTLKWVPQDFSFATMVFGQSTRTGSYVHTVAQTTDDTLPSFTLEDAHRSGTNFIKTYTGCTIKKWTLEWSATNPVTCTADIVAQQVKKDTVLSSVTPSSVRPYMFNDVKVTIGGTEITSVISGSLTVDYNPTAEFYCNSTLAGTIGQPIPSVRRYTLTITIHEADSTYFDTWLAGIAIAGTSKIELIRTASTDLAVFTLSNLKLASPPDPTTNSGPITQTLTFNCTAVAPVITDSVAAYAYETT